MINGVSPGMTPTTDTNALGHCQPEMGTWSASSHASDSAGHLGLALQAEGQRAFALMPAFGYLIIAATAGRDSGKKYNGP